MGFVKFFPDNPKFVNEVVSALGASYLGLVGRSCGGRTKELLPNMFASKRPRQLVA
jgi:hypothetical protein